MFLCLWGFPRQEYWNRLPYPPPGDFPNQGMEPRSPELQAILYHLNYQGRASHSVSEMGYLENYLPSYKMFLFFLYTATTTKVSIQFTYRVGWRENLERKTFIIGVPTPLFSPSSNKNRNKKLHSKFSHKVATTEQRFYLKIVLFDLVFS